MYYVSGIVLSTLHVKFISYFKVSKQRGQVTCPRSHNKLTAELEFNTRKSGSKTHTLNHHDILSLSTNYMFSSTANDQRKTKKNDITSFFLEVVEWHFVAKVPNAGLLEK